jgi:hypothetical protein
LNLNYYYNDLKIDLNVVYHRLEMKFYGVIKFIGKLDGWFDNIIWIGIEWDNEIGNHDGVYNGKRYFQTKSNSATFVKLDFFYENFLIIDNIDLVILFIKFKKKKLKGNFFKNL